MTASEVGDCLPDRQNTNILSNNCYIHIHQWLKTLWYPVSPPSRTARIECSLNTKPLHVSSCAGRASGRLEKSRMALMIFSGSIDRLYWRNVSSILCRYGVLYLWSAGQKQQEVWKCLWLFLAQWTLVTATSTGNWWCCEGVPLNEQQRLDCGLFDR